MSEQTQSEPIWFELLHARRSSRTFTGEPLTPDQITGLEQACLRSPTGKNKRPWRFIFVSDPLLRAELAGCKPHGAAFLAGAPLAIVVCGDDQLSDTWIEDCAVAATLIQFSAQAMGLGSCWCQVRLRETDESTSAEEWVRSVLQLPAHTRIASIIGVGYPDTKRPPVPSQELPTDRIEHR